MADRRTNMAVPIAIKWSEAEGEWTATAKSLDLVERGLTQDVALQRLEDRILSEFWDEFGAAPDLTVETRVLSAKAETSIWRYRRIDRDIFEFTAKSEEQGEVSDE
jgi:Uma2 family endonuclease